MAENLPVRPTQHRDRGPTGPAPVPEPPDPPDHLGPESSRQWRAVVAEWVIGADALPMLQAACECWDRYETARDRILEDGPVVTHPTSGALNAHPAHQVMRDNLREWRMLWRQLGLQPPEAP